MDAIDELLDEQLEMEENPLCYIDRETRKIELHEECKFFGVEHDKRVERIKFECSKEVGDENVDLTTCKAFIAYENANGEPGLYEVKDVTDEGDVVHFSWLFDEDVTAYKGEVKFIFYACRLDGDETEIAWNTVPAYGFVEEGLDAVARIEERSPAIIESMLVRIAEIERNASGATPEQIEAAVTKYLDENPVASGATATEAAQIQQNKQDIETLTREKLSADALPEAVNDALAQAKASGEFKGEPGKTPEKGKDYFTDADKQEIAELAADMVEVPEGGNGSNIEVDWIATKELTGGNTVYIPEQKVSGGLWNNLQMSLQPGFEYDVTINSEVYTCEARAYSQGAVLGNNESLTLNDYPFCILWAGGNAISGMFFKRSDISYPITLKVTDHAEYVYNQLPEGYLPDCVVKSVNGKKPYANGNVEIPTGTVTNEQIASAVEDYMAENPVQTPSGISGTAVNLLIKILKSAQYAEDQTANILALETALKTGGSGEVEPSEDGVEQIGNILSIVSGVTVTRVGDILVIE